MQVDVDVQFLRLRDDRWIKPRCRSKLVPAIGESIRVSGQILRSRVWRACDVIQHRLGERCLDRDIGGREVDARAA